MNRNEICGSCKDKESGNCETCGKRTCRKCGCTWDNACPGGCYWVEWDLCSQCVGKEPTPAELTYTFHLPEDICVIDCLHERLDTLVRMSTGLKVIRSTLKSEGEESENDYTDIGQDEVQGFD